MRSNAIKALVIGFAALLVGWACRVVIPYYQQEQDAPVKEESRQQVSAIMRAINQFVDQTPAHRLPTNLDEVAHLNVTGITRFVYLRPAGHLSQKEVFGTVVLVEKLGHYKYKDGGYGGQAGGVGAGWYSRRDYETLAQKNGLSIEQLSEPQKRQ
jgi:hypothetical protein